MFGAIEIIPLWSRAGIEAKRVIIRAIKDRKTPARIHAGLVLHELDGSYTEAADAVLRDGRIVRVILAWRLRQELNLRL